MIRWVKKRFNEFLYINNVYKDPTKSFIQYIIMAKFESKRVRSEGFYNDECPVCLDSLRDMKRIAVFPCRHAMCIKCSKQWLENAVECAVCRAGVYARS